KATAPWVPISRTATGKASRNRQRHSSDPGITPDDPASVDMALYAPPGITLDWRRRGAGQRRAACSLPTRARAESGESGKYAETVVPDEPSSTDRRVPNWAARTHSRRNKCRIKVENGERPHPIRRETWF